MIKKVFIFIIWIASTSATGCVLDPGECLTQRNHTIFSTNHCFKAILQTDGNFVVYNLKYHDPTWATMTNKMCIKTVCMQKDGNLVLTNCRNKPVWASNTDGHPNSYLKLRHDGNLIIYSKDDFIVWQAFSNGFCDDSQP